MDFDFEFANSFIYLIQNFGGGTNSPHFWLGGVIAPPAGIHAKIRTILRTKILPKTLLKCFCAWFKRPTPSSHHKYSYNLFSKKDASSCKNVSW